MAASERSEEPIPGPTVSEAFSGRENGTKTINRFQHPSGRKGYGKATQILRGVAMTFYFLFCCALYVVTYAFSHITS
jgi:hypothetical protein